MKTTIINIIKNKGTYLLMLFVILFAMETYAQLRGSRRVARRTARRTTRRNVGYSGGGNGGEYTSTPSGENSQPYYQGTNVVYGKAQ